MLLVGCMRILFSHLYICLRVFVGTRCSHSYLCLPLFISQPSSMYRFPSVVFAASQAPIVLVLSIGHCLPVSTFSIMSLRCRHCLPSTECPRPSTSSSFIIVVVVVVGAISLPSLSRFRLYLASISVSDICLWFFLAVVGHVSSWIGLESRIVLESWIV